MYFYVPADKQVRVSAMPEAGRVPTPILFLAGRGDLLRDFKAEEVPRAGRRDRQLAPCACDRFARNPSTTRSRWSWTAPRMPCGS